MSKRKSVAAEFFKENSGQLDFFNTTCCLSLQTKINKYLQDIIPCRLSFMLWLIEDTEEGTINVIGDSILRDEIWCSIPEVGKLDKSLTGFGKYDLDQILQVALEGHINPKPTRVFKHPVRHPEQIKKLMFIVCLVDHNEPVDKDALNDLFRIHRGPLISTFQLKMEKARREFSHQLLALAKTLYLHLGDLKDLLHEILSEARQITGGERCSLFLLSEDGSELAAKLFDGLPIEAMEDLRVPISMGIAGHVATTGRILNVKDAYTSPYFNKKVDEVTGFTTKNLLCFPVRDGQEKIVGVVQICNKPTGFNFLDEEVAGVLTTFCGISLMHSLVYKKLQQSQARSRLSNELLMYHLSVSNEMVNSVICCSHVHDYFSLMDWRWACRDASLDATPCMVLHMYESMGFITSCRIHRGTLARFILVVRRGYRDVTYHNWMHAFSAGHFVYSLMKQLDLIEKSIITELEGVCLLTALICHDLDHRGTTNSFQTKSKNSLACLYSSEGSIMERHHFAQTLAILNTEDCNIFENIDSSTYRRILELIRDFILATDLALHISHLKKHRAISECFDPERRDHRSSLLALIVTSADLCDQVKGWSYTRQVAQIIYQEFFLQGDLEKAMGFLPAIMLDRDRADIPQLQVQFLTEICLPCYATLAKFFPSLEPCVWSLEEGIKRWEIAKKWFSLPEQAGRPIMELLNDPHLESYVYDDITEQENYDY